MKILYVAKKRICSFFQKKSFGKLGNKSYVESPLKLTGTKNAYFGNSVYFFKGARIELVERHLNRKFNPMLTIGDNTSFEQNAHIICASNMKIGKECTFSARVFITNINHSYECLSQKVLLQKYEIKDVEIGDYCFIGMDVKIFPGVHIGNNVILGANSLVLNDIPSYSVAVGTPAKVIKKYNFDLNKWVSVNN